ncbi:abortive infection family protein [Mycobacteroides abscessus]|uniref:abortive infection family protein n=1 Tax=Mycobacteroides abscessus TaxID=36809 RepID=UPI00266FFCBD|nr:abortive infection family protein [Mycobacteroides abscessus]MDO3110466.1 abortive infection family protein [Mycobacteroides abscessus subsp. abscessus]
MTAGVLSPNTIRVLLDLFAADWSERTIIDVFTDADIPPAPEGTAPAESGVRRTTARRYLHSVDLTTPRGCARLIPVFEQVLDKLTGWDGRPDQTKRRLIILLGRDGYERLDDGTIRPTVAPVLADLETEVLDEDVIREHLDRLQRGMADDPAIAIGSSKELIESVCKLALGHLGEEFDDRADVPALVKQTLKALHLHPDLIAPTAPASDATKKILGSLSTLAVGVAELRNQIGTGHGRGVAHTLSARHAHLAVGASTTFTRLILETLEDPAAPWRKGRGGAASQR